MDISIQQGTLRIDCLRADIFRVRFSQQGGFTEPALNRYGVLHEPDAEVTCDTREDEQAVVLTTSCATLTADKKPAVSAWRGRTAEHCCKIRRIRKVQAKGSTCPSGWSRAKSSTVWVT